MSSGINGVKTLGLGLLSLMVVMGLVFIVGSQFQKTICEDIDGGTYSAAGNTCSTPSRAFNTTQDIITAIELVVAFLTIVVLVLIVKMLISNVKGMSSDSE